MTDDDIEEIANKQLLYLFTQNSVIMIDDVKRLQDLTSW